MSSKEISPAIEHWDSDVVEPTEFFDGHPAQGILPEDAKDEEEAVGFIGDDGIGEDSVCVAAAAADHAGDSDLDACHPPVHEVDQMPFVVGMYAATSLLTAGRTLLRLHMKTGHSFGMNDLAGIFGGVKS